jgi:23S rRNA (uracil1939-C5)-methyltransferase
LIAGMKAFDQIPQLEVAVGDNAISIIVRHLADLAAEDRDRLVEFGKHYDIHIYLQPEGVGSVYPLWPDKSELFYCLEDYGIEMHFRPTDFTQVNADINRRMVSQAIELLAVESSDRVLDLFSGIGNFSLPLARIAASVVGVEGDAGLVKRARDNASRNGIENVEFHVEDLAGESRGSNIMKQPFDKVLLDPPRTGAAELISDVAGLGAKRVVYVSCNPATLARDAGELVNGYRYRLRSAGVMDMFPHTAHVEAIALFER